MIRIIDNHGQYVHLIRKNFDYMRVPAEIVPNTVDPDEVVEESDGIVVSGGPDRERAGNSREIIERAAGEVPVLGICLGHQLMAEVFGGEVDWAAGREEYARTEVEILDHTGIFEGLPDRITAWASHKDEVKEVPEGFVVTARSEKCEVEAMRHETEHLYGVQFHPELKFTEYGADILANFARICGHEPRG
ncbi:MAG: GMP synthase subunit A [Methanopyri archaeon]|nr:GMP synthase subunit A [Methanopyri archaeon]